MTKSLQRTFAITAPTAALMNVAEQPLIAPRYLNFLTSICRNTEVPCPEGHAAYEVGVSYRAILKAEAIVYHGVDRNQNLAFLSHDGPLAAFDAVFALKDGEVVLVCTYHAKVPLISMLVNKLVDRALVQVAGAMDRYAASHDQVVFS
jgi:hypothetical protein